MLADLKKKTKFYNIFTKWPELWRDAVLWKGEFYRRMNLVNEYQITFSRNLRKYLIAKAINVNERAFAH